MKKILSFAIVLVFVLSGLGVGELSDTNTTINSNENNVITSFDDSSLYAYQYELEGEVVSRDWTIVATYSIPEGASGLAYDGTDLYCGIYGANGDEVYQIDPVTGSYSLLFNGPQDDAFGLTYDGTYFWTTDHPGSSSTPAIAMQLDMAGNLISQFNLPDHYMSGIAYGSGDFWVATYYPDPSTIYKVDGTGTILNQFTAPDNQPWDLCLENSNLWMADYWGDALYKIDPSTGNLLETHASNGVDPAGIVWDGQYLWYCDNGQGYDQDYLYKIDLGGGGTPEINVPITNHDYGAVSVGDSVTWNATVENIGTGDLEINNVAFTGTGYEDLSCPLTFPITIDPGNQSEIPIIFEPQDIGPLDAIATIESNDPVNPQVDITLLGNGVATDPDIYLPVDSYNYGNVRWYATTRWLMEVQNLGNDILTITDIISDDSHFYIDDQIAFPLNIAVLETIEIGVWFQPDSDELVAATITISSNDPDENPYYVSVQGTGIDTEYPIGDLLWQYEIDTSYDNSPKAIAPIPDVSGDGIDDVIICSEDYYVRCFNGNSHGYADVLWEHEIYGGSIYSQKGLTITEDVNSDGYNDVVVGAAWGARLIRTISGRTGDTIWTHDTHEYGDGGWVYSVDCSYDYNDDGIVDVLASTGDDSSDTGPKRIYCLNGETGISIWECPLGGPGFSAIGIEDFTGDGKPDVLAGASNEYESIGYAYGINGETGAIEWTFTVAGSSVWALEQIDDVTSDGIKDVIVGDFTGMIYGLDATTGGQEYSRSLGAVIITRFVKLDDVNGDGHPDIIPAHSTTHVTQVIDGQTGNFIWTHTVADQPWNVAKTSDISGDGINDVFVGTLYSNNYCYFLNGVDGSELHSINLGTPVDAISAIPDIVGDGSMEMVAGGRNGYVFCFSGGLDVIEIDAEFTADITEGPVPLTVHFTDLSTGENPIISWEWDFDDDGVIDSEEQDPTWTYYEEGTYTVSLTISDGVVTDTETKEDYITVLPGEAALEIGEISGGLLRINAEINNIGDEEVNEVNWSITLDGNFVILGKDSSGIISSISVNDSETVTDRPVFGLGRVEITVTADAADVTPVTKTVDGFIFLFFVIVQG